MVVGWRYTSRRCKLPLLQRGDAQGGFSEAVLNPSCGGSRLLLAAWGEPARPGLPPEGETGKGESKLLAAAGVFVLAVASCHAPSLYALKPMLPLDTQNSRFYQPAKLDRFDDIDELL
jgi:hypothetical protein